jgi:hypothetical protein
LVLSIEIGDAPERVFGFHLVFLIPVPADFKIPCSLIVVDCVLNDVFPADVAILTEPGRGGDQTEGQDGDVLP